METCNGGVFWGFMDGSALIVPINLILVLLFFTLMVKAAGWERFGWALIWAGGALNLSERLIFGCVRDYWRPVGFWPTFNLADVLIVTGVFVFGAVFWKKNKL